MRFKPLENKYDKLPKITEKMPKNAVKIDSGLSWWAKLKKKGIEIGVRVRV
jgi:hypothetical protein